VGWRFLGIILKTHNAKLLLSTIILLFKLNLIDT